MPIFLYTLEVGPRVKSQEQGCYKRSIKMFDTKLELKSCTLQNLKQRVRDFIALLAKARSHTLSV